MDELYVPVFVSPEEMADLVNDIDIISIDIIRLLGWVIVLVSAAFIFGSLAICFGSPQCSYA